MKTADKKNWEDNYQKSELRDADFTSISGRPLRPLYTRDDR